MSNYNYNPWANINGYPYGYINNTTIPNVNNMNWNCIPSSNILNGRLVENIDIAKTAEVPIGSFGIFPKADLSEIYIKSWNADGTTNLLTYSLANESVPNQENETIQILKSLENKIDNLIAKGNRKESCSNDY